jgi:2-phosphosulfolactate phosphatase
MFCAAAEFTRMQNTIEVLFSPAEFSALKHRDLRNSVCVVFDILRATTSMMTALANGAEAIIPVTEISEALAIHKTRPVLLAGERDGLRIRAAQTGGVDFDLGNSPREFTAEKVRGKTIAMTTTNGTRALQSCAKAKTVLIGSFLNLNALADWIFSKKPADLILVCAGTFEEAAFEDTLAAGVLCELLTEKNFGATFLDSAEIARQTARQANGNFLDALRFSRNARRLLSMPDLRDDVAFCARRDTIHFVAGMENGLIKVCGCGN